MSIELSNNVVGEAVAGYGVAVLTAASVRLDLLPDTTATFLTGLAAGSLLIGHALWRASDETRHTAS